MPRVSIRSLANLMLGLTTDSPSDSPPIDDTLQLIELAGDNHLAVEPGARPKSGGGRGSRAAAVGLLGIVQLRAGMKPVHIIEFEVEGAAGALPSFYVQDTDPINANRADVAHWTIGPAQSAVLETGTGAAIANSQPAVIARVYRQPIYLEPGEVMGAIGLIANQVVTASFQWQEIN